MEYRITGKRLDASVPGSGEVARGFTTTEAAEKAIYAALAAGWSDLRLEFLLPGAGTGALAEDDQELLRRVLTHTTAEERDRLLAVLTRRDPGLVARLRAEAPGVLDSSLFVQGLACGRLRS